MRYLITSNLGLISMNELYLCESKQIDLKSTLDGGQAFRWHRHKNGFKGIIGYCSYYIFIKNKKIYISSDDLGKEKIAFIKNYLDLEYNLNLLARNFESNLYLSNLFKKYFGLRILKQDPWETVVCFITSSVSNISKIKKNINDLCLNIGDRVGMGKYDYAFPNPEKIINFGEENLRKLGFGFRSPYIIDASIKVINKEIVLDDLFNFSYEKSLSELTKIKGVGRKVADCIMTYGLQREDVFAVDRWVRRGLVNNLNYNSKYDNDKLSVVARNNFGSFSSYIQQYIFYGEKT